MPGHVMRFRLGHAMLVVVAVALLLATLRLAIHAYPHVRRCHELAGYEDRLSLGYRRTATRYRTCVQAVPCAASEYCYNACLNHVNAPGAGRPPPSDEDRARVADEHRRAAEDYERAAGLHAARARLYRRAMFRWSQPLPTRSGDDQDAADVSRRYRCDSF